MKRHVLSILAFLVTFSGVSEAHYNPKIGRFMSRDPIEEKGGVNTYAFVRNAPINNFDHLGLAPGDIHETQEEADQSAANYIAGRTAESRQIGLMGLQRSIRYSLSSSRIKAGGSGLYYKYGTVTMQGVFKQETIVLGVVGMEYAIRVFEIEFDLEDGVVCKRYIEGTEVEGSLPTDEDFGSGTMGTVVVDDSINPLGNGGKIVSRFHTHSMWEYRIDPLTRTLVLVGIGNSSASDQDIVNADPEADNIIVLDGTNRPPFTNDAGRYPYQPSPLDPVVGPGPPPGFGPDVGPGPEIVPFK